MSKQVYYLSGGGLPKAQTSFPIITWSYKWRNRKGQLTWKFAEALRELTDFYYFEN